MHFDDRLQTLLDAPVADPRDRAVRWRQLVDLLARGEAANSAAPVAALDLVLREAFAIDEEVRPPALLSVLAAQPLRIAASLFATLTLSEEDAARILGGADADVRALVRIKLAPTPSAESASDLAQAGPAPPEPSIGEMVSRIERLQQRRAPAEHVALSPPPERQPSRLQVLRWPQSETCSACRRPRT